LSWDGRRSDWDPELGQAACGRRQFHDPSSWIATVPGIAVTVAVPAFNLFGDGVREVMDIKR
jgi:ABC-type dipeptide/oligopeptide/nickel transport system permease subunit